MVLITWANDYWSELTYILFEQLPVAGLDLHPPFQGGVIHPTAAAVGQLSDTDQIPGL